MDLVRGLDRTVIAAIHDLNIAALYCDRLYAVKDGKIVGEGTPRELLTPEFIRKVYEVDAQVMLGNDGAIHILYHAQGKGFGRDEAYCDSDLYGSLPYLYGSSMLGRMEQERPSICPLCGGRGSIECFSTL